MFFLYMSSAFMFFYIIYTCIFGSNRHITDIKTFDYKNEEHEFVIDNIKFYKGNKCIETKEYDEHSVSQVPKNFELNVDFIYDFFVVNYNYNSKNYKFLSDNKFLTFPIYSKEQIKSYVYINKIKKAEIKYETKETTEMSNSIIITDEINKFVGPNYNFYKDTDFKFKTESLISYLKAENFINEIDSNNVSYKFIFYDNFNNEYSDYNDYIIWDPNLRL
jgi:hypothetical protein